MRAALEAEGLTQSELARITGQTRQEISKMVLGRRHIGPKVALIIAGPLNIPANDLLLASASDQMRDHKRGKNGK